VKTLSIKQPWAWLIANGYKDVENRTWKTKFRGQLLIHAGKKIDKAGLEYVRSVIDAFELPTVFETGGIVGIANLVDVVEECTSQWFTGPYGFVIEDAKPLTFQAARGQLGFFEVEYKDGI